MILSSVMICEVTHILKGRVSVLVIVFVGQCEVFVLILVISPPPMAAKLIGPRTGCQFFKKMSIFPTHIPSKRTYDRESLFHHNIDAFMSRIQYVQNRENQMGSTW